jgi:hypothetical protein
MRVSFSSSSRTTFSPPTPYSNGDWQKDEDIPTTNTNEIVVLTSFFEWGFCLPSCEFLRGLLHHYKIELVHLNPNSILQLVIFIHLCECYLTAPNFSFFMYYFILKYQLSVAKRKIISNVGIQTRPHRDFLDLPLNVLKNGTSFVWQYTSYQSAISASPK